MTDYTIPALNPAAALTGAEMVEVYQGAAPSKRTTTANIAALGGGGGGPANQPIDLALVNVVDVTPSNSVILCPCTTSGGAGVDTLNLPNLPATVGGYNPQRIGQRVIVWLATLTNPADSISIECAGNPAVPVLFDATNTGLLNTNRSADGGGVALTAIGQIGVFVWCGDKWYWDELAADYNDAAAYTTQDLHIAAAANQAVIITPGAGKLIFLMDIPVGDPNLAGAPFTALAATPGTPQPLMISGG